MARPTINDAGSDLKGLELAAMNVPCIASPIPSYVEWRKDNDTGCIVLPDNEPATWIEALTRLIEDTGMRQRMAGEARRFAETRSIDAWAPRWMAVYLEAARRLGLSWAR
jgi:glycosyltransferase involved in cell wall biosynthesis